MIDLTIRSHHKDTSDLENLYKQYAIQIQSKLDSKTTACLESIQLQIPSIDTFNSP